MTDIQTAVEHNLSLIAAHLDATFENAAPVVVIANAQASRLREAYLATLMADYCGKVSFSGPVVRESALCLYRLGYRVRFFENEPLRYTLAGQARDLSAHERLEAVAHFAREL